MKHLDEFPSHFVTAGQPTAECCPSPSRFSMDRTPLKIARQVLNFEQASARYRVGAQTFAANRQAAPGSKQTLEGGDWGIYWKPTRRRDFGGPTQAEIARAMRAVKQVGGGFDVEVMPDRIRLTPSQGGIAPQTKKTRDYVL